MLRFPSLTVRLRGLVLLAVALAVLGWDCARHRSASGALPAFPAAVWPLAAAGVATPAISPVATPLAAVAANPAGTALSALSAGFTRVAGGSIPMPGHTPAAHASSLVAMPAGSPAALLAFWFAGARESAPDVQIAFSWFERASGSWQASRFVVNKEAMGAQLGFGLRRLGNPVAWRDAEGRIHLFVVATGLGGWAAGRVLHLRQTGPALQDRAALEALAFEPVRVLPLSWLWNTSHLVRSAPLPLADGGMLLPLYFELGIKYPVAARFGPAGEFLGLQRLSRRSSLLQPTLVMQDATHWLAFLREHGPAQKVAVAGTANAGADWQDLPSLALNNPDASVAGLGLAPGLMVLAYNPLTTGRQALDLAASANGQDWRTIATLAKGDATSEYSYPALAWADGDLWVSYTDQRQRIAWQRLRPVAGVEARP